MLKQAGKTILLVEDVEAQVLLVQQAVATCPGDVHLAVVRDTADALQWLNDAEEDGLAMPCLILLDLKLPKIAGLAVLRTLRMDDRLQNVPIVVYSEQHEPADVVLSYQIGANSFVKRPVDFDEFSRLLHDIAGLGWLDRLPSEAAMAASAR